MNIFQFEPTEIAEWRKLVSEGEKKAGFQLTETVENYMVLTLNAYTKDIRVASKIIALDFLENVHVDSAKNIYELRCVGDHCLILAGLFPGRAKRKNVSEKYFQHVGEHAYYVLSFSKLPWDCDQTLFYQLFENFSDLIQILRAMRLSSRNILH